MPCVCRQRQSVSFIFQYVYVFGLRVSRKFVWSFFKFKTCNVQCTTCVHHNIKSYRLPVGVSRVFFKRTATSSAALIIFGSWVVWIFSSLTRRQRPVRSKRALVCRTSVVVEYVKTRHTLRKQVTCCDVSWSSWNIPFQNRSRDKYIERSRN